MNSVVIFIVVAKTTMMTATELTVMMLPSYFVDIVRLDRFVEGSVEVIQKGHDLFKEKIT